MPTNVETASRGFEAALAGDIDALQDFLDPEVSWHGGDPDAEGACRNREQVLSLIRQASAHGAIGELVEVVDAGDQVVVLLRPSGTERIVANLTTFRDGRAVEMVHYPDPDDAMRAAGL